MATSQGQGLTAFLSNSIVGLDTGADSPFRIFLLSQLYPSLSSVMANRQKELNAAFAAGDDKKFTYALKQSLQDALTAIDKLENAPQLREKFQHEQPVAAVNERAIDSHAQNLKTVQPDIQKTTARVYGKTQAGVNRAWIDKLVDNWVKNLPRNERAEAGEQIRESILQTVSNNPDAPASAVIDEAVRRVPEQNIKQLIDNDQFIKRYVRINQEQRDAIDQTITNAVLTSNQPDVTMAAISALAADMHPVNPNFLPTAIRGITLRAAAIAEASQAFSASPVQIEAGLRQTGNDIFRSLAKTPWQKMVAPFADAAVALIGADKSQAMIHVVQGAWNREMQNTKSLERVLGSAFYSNIVQQMIRSGTNDAFSRRAGPMGVLSPFQKGVTDVFTSIFRPNISENYLRAVALHSAMSGGMRIQTRTTMIYYPAWQQLMVSAWSSSSISGTLFSWGAKEAGVFGAKRLAGEGARRVGSSFLKKLLSLLAGKAAGTGLAAAGTAVAPGVGTILGFIAGEILGRAMGFIGNGLKSLASFLSGDFFVRMLAGDAQETNLFFLFVGLALMVILIPLSPINTSTYEIVRNVVFVAPPLGGGEGEGEGVDCAVTPDHPFCHTTPCDPSKPSGCKWPTTGTISQGPMTGCQSSHRTLNAIDIGAPTGTDVWATTTGTVTYVFRGCTDETGSMNPGDANSECGGDGYRRYGNVVVIESDSSEKYTLIFGHLSQSSIFVNAGDKITNPGQVIAKVDHNGYSSGAHLHFGVLAGTNINSYLPVQVPACSNNTDGCDSCTINGSAIATGQ